MSVTTEDYRRDDVSQWVEPVCEWRPGRPTPALTVGDRVHMCTASFVWVVAQVAQDGLVVLAPTDKTHGIHVAHVAHLDAIEQPESEPSPDTPSMLDLLNGETS